MRWTTPLMISNLTLPKRKKSDQHISKMAFLVDDGSDGIVLSVYIQPRSSSNKIAGLHSDALKICITTPPVEGKANKAVIAFLAKFFGLPKSSVTIKSGQKSRTKNIKLAGISRSQAEKTLSDFV